MREREDHGERIHRRIWELLPWYVNGSLAERERQQVETHLAGCAGCQAEERACRRTAVAVSGAGEMSPSPHPAQFRRLLDRIEQEELPRRGRLAALLQATPRPLRGALLAQAAMILLLVGALAWGAGRPAPAPAAPSPSAPGVTYRTLSDPVARPARVLRLRLMFSPRATEREVREILLGIRCEIVAGPSPLGVYTVEVPATGDPVGIVLARLRTESQVVFAEPAAGDGATSPGRPPEGLSGR
ncbi:MAG TPA: zf-HC2 domain-containing protein [Thermoanaerobaculia bacterium]